MLGSLLPVYTPLNEMAVLVVKDYRKVFKHLDLVQFFPFIHF